MEQNKNEYLKEILNNKRNLIEIIAAAIIIGLGINFIASSIFEYLDIYNKNLVFLLIGLFLCLIGFLYYINRFFGKKRFSKTVDGFFILDIKKKRIVNIDNYDFGNNLFRNLKYVFAENKALKKIWKNLDFENILSNNDEFLHITNEASEYYLLEKLSTHLSIHFNNTDFNKNDLVEFERNDIPDVLLSNRFLEQFSKPMNERETFISEEMRESSNEVFRITRDEKEEEDENIGKVVSSYVNGAMFNHFDLILPKKSILKRNDDGSISLITKRFTINIKTIVSGINTYIEKEFIENYLNKDYSSDLPAFIVRFEFNIIFNMSSLFYTKSWKYYEWIDSFIEQIEKDVSQDYYFDKKIEWNKTYPIIKMLKKKKKKITDKA